MFQIEIYTVVQNHFGNDIMCHNKTVLDGLNILVSVSIPLKILGIVSLSYRFEKAGIAHPPNC